MAETLLRFNKGLEENLPEVKQADELYFTTDSGKMWLGDIELCPSLDTTVKLASDLYAYTNIGKISASNTSPTKVASKDDSLKDVFNAVFGTQQDVQPSISTAGTSLLVSAGKTSYGGGEYGAAVASTDVTITFTLNNSGTANYGYRCGSTKHTGSQTFYYAVTKQDNGDIKITLPSGQTASSSMVIAGTYASHSGNVLYCNFNDNKQVSIKISLPSGSVAMSSQTRYEIISASVTLGTAQRENQLTTGTAITRFLTYLENDATSTSALSGGSESGTAGPYTISAGSKYTYYSVTSDTTIPTTWRKYANSTSVTDLTITANAGEYIWIASALSYTNIYEFNEVSGKYNTDATPTIKSSNQTIKNSQGVNTSGYYIYRITNPRAVSGSSKFKLA